MLCLSLVVLDLYQMHLQPLAGHDCDGWWWPTVSPVWRMADSVRLPRYRTISDEWLHKLFLTLNHPIECGDSTQWLIRCPLPPLLPPPPPASPTLGMGTRNTGYLHCLHCLHICRTYICLRSIPVSPNVVQSSLPKSRSNALDILLHGQ